MLQGAGGKGYDLESKAVLLPPTGEEYIEAETLPEDVIARPDICTFEHHRSVPIGWFG